MNIEKYPQYQLYKFTLLLEENKAMYIKPDIESRAVDGTIINRAYYSAYSYALLWLEEISGFKLKQKWEYESEGKKYVSEHRQVRDCLIKYEKMKASKNLYELHRLRKKADYKLFNPLTEKEINDSIKYMENVLNE
ncbi:MAG: hypothetical protein Q4Q24_00115 [Methanobrevibacter ruminantium]|nr:hypothetical protein [Methanobrevibacter ruminantium]MDO5841657.1 hypothetical protein [Methanobrevibacter ruminantium]